jgi:hypothetical protein
VNSHMERCTFEGCVSLQAVPCSLTRPSATLSPSGAKELTLVFSPPSPPFLFCWGEGTCAAWPSQMRVD